jgi:hypothetical protein
MSRLRSIVLYRTRPFAAPRLLMLATFVTSLASAETDLLRDRPTAAENEAAKLVCKYERPMGSLIKRKTCRTKAEIAATSAESQKKIKELQDKSVLGPPLGEKYPTGG